jgi:organic hydroperoxide reductase OsmC/OhrA
MTVAELVAPASIATEAIHSRYPVTLRWTDERRALASSADGLPEIAVGPPPAFDGMPGLWSPEHLFVLAAASCWLTTFLTVARLSHLDLVDVEVDASGDVARRADRRFHVPGMVLRPRVTIAHEADRERALRLIAKAEAGCLVAQSMRTEVTLEPVVVALERSARGLARPAG